MTLAALTEAANSESLDVLGHFATVPEDDLGGGTLVLLGPREPGFWAHLTRSPEWTDSGPDPLDRWSLRIITALADDFDGEAFFPFGEPLRPFMSWALRTGRAWSSPVGLLVHDTAGLLVSYRGAVLLPQSVPAPTPSDKPCLTCPDKPCLTACPVGALTEGNYDLTACHAFLDQPAGTECMARGCQVRRACPVSQSYRRVDAQSAYHMGQFHI